MQKPGGKNNILSQPKPIILAGISQCLKFNTGIPVFQILPRSPTIFVDSQTGATAGLPLIARRGLDRPIFDSQMGVATGPYLIARRGLRQTHI